MKISGPTCPHDRGKTDTRRGVSYFIDVPYLFQGHNWERVKENQVSFI